MLSTAEAQESALRQCTEAIVCTAGGLGLVTATPLQQAICRIADGRPLRELAEHPHVLEAVGRVDLLWGEPPDELIVLLPSRTGKSTIIAGMAIRASQTVDLSLAMTEGEPPVYAILSLDKEKAKAVYGVVERALKGRFRALCVRDPRSSENGGSALVRHPSGAEVEIAVVAGKAAGAAVISRWLIGLAIDEAARMQGSDRVINLPDTLAAARDRMLPGAQIAMISSKWAPYGPIYDACRDHGGRPSRSQSLVVVGAQGGQAEKLNPAYYTPKRLAKLKAKRDDAAWRVSRNEWQTPAQKLFALAYLEQLARPTAKCGCGPRQRNGFPSENRRTPDGKPAPACPHNDSPPHPRQHYLAIVDPASKGNAFALVLLTVRELPVKPTWRCAWCGRETHSSVRLAGGASTGDGWCESCCSAQEGQRAAPMEYRLESGCRDDVALVRQWQGSPQAPLDDDAIWAEIASLLRPYRCNRCISDEWASEQHRTIARHHGIFLTTYPSSSPEKHESCQAIAAALSAHEHGHYHHRSLELHPCPALLGDLSRIEKRPTMNGVQIHYPVTGDGRHCDLAAALVKGYGQVLQQPDKEPEPVPPGWTREELQAAERYAQGLGLVEGTPVECQYEELEEP